MSKTFNNKIPLYYIGIIGKESMNVNVRIDVNDILTEKVE